jgi:hypothetical protein
MRIPFSKPPYAALWKSSIWRIQLVSGFHLGQIWATTLRSPAFMSELRVASHPSRSIAGEGLHFNELVDGHAKGVHHSGAASARAATVD